MILFCFPNTPIDGPNSIPRSKTKRKRRKFPCTYDVIEGVARIPVKYARVTVFGLSDGGSECLAGCLRAYAEPLLPFLDENAGLFSF